MAGDIKPAQKSEGNRDICRRSGGNQRHRTTELTVLKCRPISALFASRKFGQNSSDTLSLAYGCKGNIGKFCNGHFHTRRQTNRLDGQVVRLMRILDGQLSL